MDARLPKKYILIPVFYVAVIILFLFLQFTGGKKLNGTFGIIEISSTYRSGSGRKQVLESLDLSWDGLHLAFSPSSKLSLTAADGSEKEVPVTSYSILPESLEVVFANFMVLRFSYANSSSKSIIIQTDAADSPLRIKTAHIPYTIEGGITLEEEAGLPILSMHNSGGQAFVILPRGSSRDGSARRFNVALSEGMAFLRYTQAEGASADPALFWFTSQLESLAEGESEKVMSAFLDQSYRGWLSVRYRQQEGVWENADGNTGFSETLLAALLAEAMKRGQYADVQAKLWAVQNLNKALLTFSTAPFYGDLLTVTEKFQQSDLALIGDITDKIKRRDISVLSYPHILSIIVDRGPFSLSQELIVLISSLTEKNLNPNLVLDLGNIYIEAMDLGMDVPELRDTVFAGIGKYIYPAIEVANNAALVLNGKGEGDTMLTLRTSRLFRELNKRTPNPLFALLGNRMLTDIFSYANETGFLPATFAVEDSGVEPSKQMLAPELAYTMVTDNSYYPAETSFLSSYGPGSWAWSAADVTGNQVDQNTFELSITYPVGEIHNLVIQGIRPFIDLTMLDLPWRGDRYFQEYTSGWFYREDTRTLYIKLRNKKETERIIINF